MSGTFKLLREAEERAENRTGNIMEAAINLIQDKNNTWLGLLEENASDKTKNIIVTESFVLLTHLERKKRLSDRAMLRVRMIYPEFDPDKHLGTFITDDKKRVVGFTPIKSTDVLSNDIRWAASIWMTSILHRNFVEDVIDSLSILADGLWKLTGVAFIKKVTDYTGKTNYAIDKAMADDIVSSVFPDEVTTGEGDAAAK